MKHTRHYERCIKWGDFGQAMLDEMEQRGVGVREYQRELGIASSATLSRITRGYPCSAELFLFMCHELSLNPMRFFAHAQPRR